MSEEDFRDNNEQQYDDSEAETEESSDGIGDSEEEDSY